jgi:hypothetical protein
MAAGEKQVACQALACMRLRRFFRAHRPARVDRTNYAGVSPEPALFGPWRILQTEGMKNGVLTCLLAG